MIMTIAAGLLSAACSKQEAPSDSSVKNNRQVPLKEVVFASSSEATRTTLDNGSVNWVIVD